MCFVSSNLFLFSVSDKDCTFETHYEKNVSVTFDEGPSLNENPSRLHLLQWSDLFCSY